MIGEVQMNMELHSLNVCTSAMSANALAVWIQNSNVGDVPAPPPDRSQEVHQAYRDLVRDREHYHQLVRRVSGCIQVNTLDLLTEQPVHTIH
jgi:hypothetical protein